MHALLNVLNCVLLRAYPLQDVTAQMSCEIDATLLAIAIVPNSVGD